MRDEIRSNIRSILTVLVISCVLGSTCPFVAKANVGVRTAKESVGLAFIQQPSVASFSYPDPDVSQRRPSSFSNCFLAAQHETENVLDPGDAPPRSLPLPTIPDPSTNPSDDLFRAFRRKVPKRIQSWIRDSGMMRTLMDTLVWAAVPDLLREYPWAASDFVRLTTPTSRGIVRNFTNNAFLKWWRDTTGSGDQDVGNYAAARLRDDLKFTVRKFSYGPNERQFVSTICLAPEHVRIHRTIVVVHGGAWGSGFPDMYALTATSFLNSGYSGVALVGYRTFPSADLQGQMDDVSQALELIGSTADNPLTIIGHSSGTHVLTMAFLQGQVKRLVVDRVIDQFLGLAGVYDIPSHYRFERSRGLQRISPMAAVCGYSLAGWRRSSPLILWNKSDPSYRQQMQRHFPRSTLLLHGSNDTVVPYVSTQIFAEATGLDWKLLYNVEHSEMILELMFGGATQHIAMEWIELHHGDRMRAK